MEANGEVLHCEAGFDGGLEQRFLAQVISTTDYYGTLVNASANLVPVFHIPGLLSHSFADDEDSNEV